MKIKLITLRDDNSSEYDERFIVSEIIFRIFQPLLSGIKNNKTEKEMIPSFLLSNDQHKIIESAIENYIKEDISLYTLYFEVFYIMQEISDIEISKAEFLG